MVNWIDVIRICILCCVDCVVVWIRWISHGVIKKWSRKLVKEFWREKTVMKWIWMIMMIWVIFDDRIVILMMIIVVLWSIWLILRCLWWLMVVCYGGSLLEWWLKFVSGGLSLLEWWPEFVRVVAGNGWANCALMPYWI